MTYATEASILHGAPRTRLQNLTAILTEYGCVSRIEWHRRVIVFELPEDNVAWILTGGFAELLAAYEDCLQWRPRFSEHIRPAPRLPPPRVNA